MISCNYISNRNSFKKVDILNREGGDYMDIIYKLQSITEDIKKSYDIPHLYSRVEVLHAAEIEAIFKQLDFMKVCIDIEYKFMDMPINIINFREILICLMMDIQDLYKNVLNKNDGLIKKYNLYIRETLRSITI
jgi:hypothetical protein